MQKSAHAWLDRFDASLTAWESTRSGQLPDYPTVGTIRWFTEHPDLDARWYPLAMRYDRALFPQPAQSTAHAQTPISDADGPVVDEDAVLRFLVESNGGSKADFDPPSIKSFQ